MHVCGVTGQEHKEVQTKPHTTLLSSTKFRIRIYTYRSSPYKCHGIRVAIGVHEKPGEFKGIIGQVYGDFIVSI